MTFVKTSVACFAGLDSFRADYPRLGYASPGATFYRLLTQAG